MDGNLDGNIESLPIDEQLITPGSVGNYSNENIAAEAEFLDVNDSQTINNNKFTEQINQNEFNNNILEKEDIELVSSNTNDATYDEHTNVSIPIVNANNLTTNNEQSILYNTEENLEKNQDDNIDEKESIKEKKPKANLNISSTSIYITIAAILNYIIIAPLIERFLVGKMAKNAIASIMVSKAGISIEPGLGFYLTTTLLTFVTLFSFVLVMLGIIDIFLCGRLFEKTESLITKFMLISLLYSIVVTALLVYAKIDLFTITIKATTLNGYQLFIYRLF